jgi:FkbM family methyltransferase
MGEGLLDCETGRQDESQPVKIIANELIDRDSTAAKDKYAAFADEQAAWIGRSRNIRSVVRAALSKRQYRAALRALTVCSDPVGLLRNYALGSGSYPCEVALRTPAGNTSLQVYGWHDLRTIHEIFLAEDYAIGRKAGVIVDYGSNIGVSAAYFLTRNPNNYCYLFEPAPTNIQRLNHNMKQFWGRYTLNECAVGIENCRIAFGVEDTGRYGGIGQQTGNYITVDCVDSHEVLEEIIEAHGKIDVLKIDVETMEKAIVERLSQSLASQIDLLLVEYRFKKNPLPATHVLSVQGTVSRFSRKA